MSARSAWLMNQAKHIASLVRSGSGSVAAVGDKVGGCGVDTGGVGGAGAVAGVVFAAGVNTVAFFVDFFLLDGAGIVFASWTCGRA
jgi:hypothetical protein